MELPSGDPKAVFSQASDELQNKFQECGMSAVDDFLKKMDGIQDMVKKDPAELVTQVKELVNGVKGKIDDLLNDPSSLAPSGSAIAKCAGWYGKAVCKKLKAFQGEVEYLLETMQGLVKELGDSMKKLRGTLESVLDSLKKLTSLPTNVSGLMEGINGAEDVAKVETEPLKECLDADCILKPVDGLETLKDPVTLAVARVKMGVQNIIDFITDAPDTIKKAFAIPSPCCCCGCLMSMEPAAMTQLLTMIDGIKELDLTPVTEGFEKVRAGVCDFDTETVSVPVKAFAEQAAGPVGTLDSAVEAAKLASAGPGGFIDQVKSMF